jgi:heptaprenyl diphosphate synthase
MRKTKRLTLLSLLTAMALALHVLEALLPPLTAIPGVKPGLANIMTLVTMALLGPGDALAVLLARVVLGSLIAGQVTAIGYSLAGGLPAYALLLALYRRFPRRQLWVLSVLCAIVHNLGQIALAVLVTGTAAIVWYLPVLLISGILAGAFTGALAQLVLSRLSYIRRSDGLKRGNRS